MTYARIASAFLVFGLSAPAIAAETGPVIGTVTTAVRVPRPAGTSPKAIRVTERRIAGAAMEACGAPSSSLATVKSAVARSRCWHDSYAGGIAQLRAGAPRVTVASLRPLPSDATR